MIETFLYGNLNSRANYDRKVVVSAYVENGLAQFKVYYYQKINKKWKFIGNDWSKVDCEYFRYKQLRCLAQNVNGKSMTEDELKGLICEKI